MINSKTYTDLGDVKPVVISGGKDKLRFVPNLNMSFHNDEFYINLNRKDKVITTETATDENGKVKLSGKDTDIFYIDSEGRFKWDIEFAEHPQVYSWEWGLKHTSSLEFYYQGELTAEEVAEGCERPDEVVGSYAVYCNKKNNKYKTGKLCHIYAPVFIDANGDKKKGVLLIEKGKALTISIDKTWLDNAVYPVTLDPTIGYTTLGATAGTATDYIFARPGTSSGAGTGGTIYVGTKSTTDSYCRGALYANNSGTPVGGSKLSSSEAEITIPENASFTWRSGLITVSDGIAASTTYYPAVHFDLSTYAYDSGGTCYRASLTYNPGTNDLPSPYPTSATVTREISIYLEYTETSSGGKNYYYMNNQ